MYYKLYNICEASTHTIILFLFNSNLTDIITVSTSLGNISLQGRKIHEFPIIFL